MREDPRRTTPLPPSSSLPADVEAALETVRRTVAPAGFEALYLETTGSTNDVAAGLAHAGAPAGSVVIAGHQTAGRGRGGSSWFSPPGAGLYLSTVLRPRSLPAAGLLTLMAGSVVAEALVSACGLSCEIKWPNDVMVARASASWRKIAGVLAEGATARGHLAHAVLGIGINLRRAAYPPDLADRVTSVEVETGRDPDRGALIAELLIGLAAGVRALDAGLTEQVLERWIARSPSCRDRQVSWQDAAGRRDGVTAGIDPHGALLVTTPHGVERLWAGALQWGPPEPARPPC